MKTTEKTIAELRDIRLSLKKTRLTNELDQAYEAIEAHPFVNHPDPVLQLLRLKLHGILLDIESVDEELNDYFVEGSNAERQHYG